MADPKPVERIVLKILAGPQLGAEVSLQPGEYSIGTGAEDDIQFIDVSVKPAHLRARLAPGKIEIKNGAGTFYTSTGVQTSNGESAWQELQPLDVVYVGTTRFAFGPPTAQWATITDQIELAPKEARAKAAAAPKPLALILQARAFAIPIALLLVVFLVGGSILFALSSGSLLVPKKSIDSVAVLRKALDKFSFGRALAVTRKVDGSIYVTGFVQTPIERRAIAQTINSTGVSVNLRLGVLQVLRNEIDGLIKAENVRVDYSLNRHGVLRLQGTILDPKTAARFIADLKQNVLGLGGIETKIESAPDLFKKIRALAHLSQVDDAVVFRLNGTVVEANGVISTSKIDQWVGFLQAYSKHFSKSIGLRSYVTLQNPSDPQVAQNSGIPSMPLLLGSVPDGKGVNLDPARLNSGNFKPSDAFVGKPKIASEISKAVPEAKHVASLAPNPLSPTYLNGPATASQSAPAQKHSSDKAARAPTAPPAKTPPVVTSKRIIQPAPGAVAPVLAASAEEVSHRAAISSRKTTKASPKDPASKLTLQVNGAAPKAPAGRTDASHAPAKEKRIDADTAIGADNQDRNKSKRKGTHEILQAALPATFRHDVGDMSDRASSLIDQWLNGDLVDVNAPVSKKNQAIQRALDSLADQSLGLANPPESLSEASKELFARKYLPLFALSRQSNVKSARQCRKGSRISLDNLPAALFWLDLMSTTNAITLRDFSLDAQGFILEAALSPELVASCLKRSSKTAPLVKNSIYLTEARRNPEFVRFVTQSLPSFPLDVTGASLIGSRFIQMRDGSKLREGEAPDAASRIDSIGELGVSILLADGFAVDIYSQNINWLAER